MMEEIAFKKKKTIHPSEFFFNTAINMDFSFQISKQRCLNYESFKNQVIRNSFISKLIEIL